MRIAVNTRFLLPNRREGLGNYTSEIVKRWVKNHPEIEFFFYFDRPYDPSFIYGDNVIPRVISPPARHPVLWYAWFEWALPNALSKDQVDVLFSPDGFSSLKYSGKKVVVIHDLGFEHYPSHVPYLARKFYQRYTPRYANDANHLFAVSQTTKDDVVERYGIDDKKITVAYNGIREGFDVLTEAVKANIRAKFSRGNPYFLFVGALHPRKNIPNLLRAFQLFKDKEVNTNYQLLITGRMAWKTSEINDVYQSMKNKDDVIFTDYLERDELQLITGAASLCLYPSLFEGFGVPLLEAMNCGVPIVTSAVSCMPEIVGKAAELVDPLSPESIVEGILKVVNDKDKNQELINLGLARAKAFSWDETARVIHQGVTSIL